MYSDEIRTHIFALRADRIFTTRDLLVYARRNTVDKCLSKLVKAGAIFRVARGVFVREITELVTPEAVAMAKLEAFGKKLIAHQNNVEVRLLTGEEAPEPLKYCSDGRSGSFATVFGRIFVYNTAPRKHKLADSKHGEIISYIWDQVRKGENFIVAHRKLPLLSRFDLEDLRVNIRWMPQWLGDVHVSRPLPYLVRDQLARLTSGLRPASSCVCL